jgi:hypothetical protein
LPSADLSHASQGEHLPAHSGWEFLLQVPA